MLVEDSQHAADEAAIAADEGRGSVRRGDLRGYVRPSSPEVPRIVVILLGDNLNSSPRSWAMGTELQQRDPGDILAISGSANSTNSPWRA
jgi:hypothetical protein